MEDLKEKGREKEKEKVRETHTNFMQNEVENKTKFWYEKDRK